MATGCVGTIGDRSDGQAEGGPTGEQDEALQTGFSDLRRLTRNEAERTLRDLFGDQVVDAAASATAGLPGDEVEHGYTTMSLGITAAHVDGLFAVADRIATIVSSDPAVRGGLEPCLADQLAEQACFDAFLDGFGRRVYRRPLEEADRAALLEAYDDGKALTPEDGLQLVLLAMLQAPPFVYRIEISGPEIAGVPGTFGLSDWELATRLSYFAWGSAPDDALLDAAAAGALSTEAGLAAELDRVLADPRARVQVRGFFAEWLGLDHLPSVQQSPEFLDGIPGETLAADMRAELELAVEHHVFENDSPYAELLTSRVSFVASDPLAQVYGVSPGSGPEGQLELPAGERDGLLTRAALLVGQGEMTHPIQRGARVMRKLLCDELEPPDPNDFPPNTFVPPPFDATKTSRERWTDKTSAPACASCHQHINAFGFALEGYDTIGRFRTTELVFDPSTVQVVNELPLDTTAEIAIDASTTVAVKGAGELGAALASSQRAHACFSSQVFRFASGRRETADDDGLLDAMLVAATAEGGSMMEVLRSVVLSPQFRLRKPRM